MDEWVSGWDRQQLIDSDRPISPIHPFVHWGCNGRTATGCVGVGGDMSWPWLYMYSELFIWIIYSFLKKILFRKKEKFVDIFIYSFIHRFSLFNLAVIVCISEENEKFKNVHSLIFWSIDWLIYWLIDLWIDWLIDLWIDWLIDLWIDWLIDWLMSVLWIVIVFAVQGNDNWDKTCVFIDNLLIYCVLCHF